MGLKLSSLCSKKKSKKQKQVEYSPRTAQKMYDARRTGKPIYPPLSSIAEEEPKRSVLPDGRLLYEPVYTNSEFDQNNCKCHDERYRNGSYFDNNYNQYDDGTFAVLSREPMGRCTIFRI